MPPVDAWNARAAGCLGILPHSHASFSELPMSPLQPKRFAASTIAVAAVLATLTRPASADPTMTECISANEVAIKLRVDHKLRQARDQALVCAATSCPGEVRDACKKRVSELNAAIPSLVFEAKDSNGDDVSAVAVTMDGQPFAARLDGTAIPIDPGDHTFSFAAAGHANVEKHLVIYEGDRGRRERIQLGNGPASPPPVAPTPLALPATPPESRPSAGSTAPGLGTQKVVGLTLGVVGIAGVGVGSAFGLLTISAWSSAKSACGSGGTSSCTGDPSTVSSDRSTAQKDGTVSTVAFIAGGALVATGLVVFLTGSHRESSPAATVALAPALGPGRAGFALSGAFW